MTRAYCYVDILHNYAAALYLTRGCRYRYRWLGANLIAISRQVNHTISLAASTEVLFLYLCAWSGGYKKLRAE